MHDWNGNGKYDMRDSYIDYNLANSSSPHSGGVSGGWIFVLMVLALIICPPLGFFVIGMYVYYKFVK